MEIESTGQFMSMAVEAKGRGRSGRGGVACVVLPAPSPPSSPLVLLRLLESWLLGIFV